METNLILVLVIVWIGLSAVIGSFGTHRKIGFVGTFFASLILSPIIAMLFVLASEKSETPNNQGAKAIVITPIVICLLIIIGVVIDDAIWERKYAAMKIQQEIELLEQTEFIDVKEYDIYDTENRLRAITLRYSTETLQGLSSYEVFGSIKYNGNYYDDYDDITFDDESEFNKFKEERLKLLRSM